MASFDGRVDGVRELVRAIGQIDSELPKEIGRRNKAIGQRIIDRAFPKPEKVGEGAGAMPRASATKNLLRIMAGGSHREDHRQQWGKRTKARGGVKRPYIRRSAEADMPNVMRDYLAVLLEVAHKAGIENERG